MSRQKSVREFDRNLTRFTAQDNPIVAIRDSKKEGDLEIQHPLEVSYLQKRTETALPAEAAHDFNADVDLILTL